MRTKKYLSIDIDFWNTRSLQELRGVMKAVKEVKASGVHVEIVDEHHHLIDDIDKSGACDVTNIDYHSDIANVDSNNLTAKDLKEEESDPDILFNCGTWAGYLKRRRHFRWYYPSKCSMKSAFCHYPVTIGNNPFQYPDVAGWKKATRTKIHGFPYGVFRSVSRIGIAMSYDWLKFEKAEGLIKVVREELGPIPKPFSNSENLQKAWEVANKS